MLNRIKPLFSNHRRVQWLVAATLVLTTCLMAVEAKFVAADAKVTGERPSSTLIPPRYTPQQQERAVIRLLTDGFDPTEVTGVSGQYRLAATRGSREEQITLQLRRASGELVQEIVMPQENPDWTTLIEIQVGSYTLTVTNHPDWVCHITVQ